MDENGDPKTITIPEEEEEQKGQPAVEPTGKEPEVPEPKESEEEEEEPQEIAKDPVETEEEEEKEEPPVSRRESKRVNQLLDKLAKAEQSTAPARREASERKGKQIIPEGEYDLEQINGMAQDYAQELYNQGLSQAQAYNIANTFATRLEIDTPKVSSKYKFLDTDSDDFNPGPADFINRTFLKMVGYDPKTGVVQNQDIRYHEFVDSFMDVVELVSAGRVADSTKNVARKAAQTGVRPGGVAKTAYQGDDPRQMTDDQLEAAIAEGLGLNRK